MRDWFIADSDLARENFSDGKIDATEFAREMRRLGYGALEIVRELVSMEGDRNDA